MPKVLYVPKAKLTELGPRLLPLIERALAYSQGEYTIDNILDAILDDRMQLWGVVMDDKIVGAATTCIVVTPQMRTLLVRQVGGERMIEWYEALDTELVRFGKRKSCNMVQACGRLGWVRTMPLAGYSQQYVVMGKRIDT